MILQSYFIADSGVEPDSLAYGAKMVTRPPIRVVVLHAPGEIRTHTPFLTRVFETRLST